MENLELIGKRKKKIPKCPNPLFVKWLTEWKEEATERGIKSQYTYQKAINALKKYPLPLESGKECKILEGFGDKICKMLDDKLSQHVANGGSLEPELSDEDEMDELHIPAPRNKKNVRPLKNDTRSVRNREYIPQHRSGPYALILTLYRQKQEGKCFMKKGELMTEAQPLADKDFRRPDPGCRYTAWSSMGSLIQKGFVIKSSNPAKYSLTDAGCNLASRIEIAEQDENIGNCNNNDQLGFHIPDQVHERFHPLPTNAGMLSDRKADHIEQKFQESRISKPLLKRPASEVHAISSSDDDSDDDIMPPFAPSSAPMENLKSIDDNTIGFPFVYINAAGADVVSKDQAVVTIDDEISVGFLIKAKYEDLLLSGKQYKLDTSRVSTGGFIFAYLHNDDAPDRCKQIGSSSTISNVNLPIHNNRGTVSVAKIVPQKKDMPKQNLSIVPPSKQRSNETVSKTLSHPYVQRGLSSYSSRVSGDIDDSQKLEAQKHTDPIYVLKPGTYEIVLCVDNREVFGSGTGKEALLKELQRNNVLLDVRVLQIGDFLWIARPKGRVVGHAEELVLDYVIERKRMDDLAGSITDGRFREQKFRLKNCGLRKPIYLVEDYGSTQHFSVPEDTLLQAITNTQVTDDFYVKRTRDTKESAAYLTIMTRYLQGIYSEKCLCGFLKKDLISKKVQLDKREERLMTFEEYDRTTIKSRPLTVREMFGKHLCQIAGITPEKAVAITEVYPTPATLIQAYAECNSQKECEMLLQGIKFGLTKRSLGQALCRTLAILYSNQELS